MFVVLPLLTALLTTLLMQRIPPEEPMQMLLIFFIMALIMVAGQNCDGFLNVGEAVCPRRSWGTSSTANASRSSPSNEIRPGALVCCRF